MLTREPYALLPDGTRAGVEEANGRQVAYLYDALNRLVAERITDPAAGDRTYNYTYDLAGNRLTRDLVLPGVVTGTGVHDVLAYTYDAQDRLVSVTGADTLNGVDGVSVATSYSYDANGSTLTVTTGGGVTTNTWDLEGRLVHVAQPGGHTIDYSYNDSGDRTSETVDGSKTTFLNDPNNAYDQVLEEYAPGGVLADSYVRGLDLLFQDRGGARSFYLKDGLGSTRALTNAAGAVTDTYTYEAYGTLIGSTGTTTNEFLFAGYQNDAAVGEYYLNARYMNPAIGGFLSMDSVEGDPANPFSFNRYIYSGDDPSNNVDPSGHDFTAVSSLTGSMIAANITSIEGGVFGYVESLAQQDIHSFDDFAYANVMLAVQELFPGIVSALQLVWSGSSTAIQLLSTFNKIGFDVYDSTPEDSSIAGGPGVSTMAAPRGANLKGPGSGLTRGLSALPAAANQLNFAVMSAKSVLAALYEFYLALDITQNTDHIIPARGWGHDPNQNGADVVSIDPQGNVYLWDAKTRNYSVQNSASTTFRSSGPRNKAIGNAFDIIEADSSLDIGLKAKALSNLKIGSARYRTAYAKVGRPGWRIIPGTRK